MLMAFIHTFKQAKKSLIYYNKTLLSQTPMRNRNYRVPDTQIEIGIFPHTAAVVQNKG